MKKIAAAISFLTIIPTPKINNKGDILKYSTVYFPLVGLFIGLLLCLVYLTSSKIFPLFTTSIITILSEAILTRGLHLDGFSDFFDGMFGGHSKEDKLRIMKDHHIGVFGTISLFFLLLLKISVLCLFRSPVIYLILLIAPAVSRYIILYPILKIPYAKESGLGKQFELRTLNYMVVTFIMIIFTYMLLSFDGVMALFATFGLTWIIIRYIKKQIDGMTGDVYGFLIELSELSFIMIYYALI